MTDYVVLTPPGVEVRVVRARVDAPILLPADQVDAWATLQAAIQAARAAGLDVGGITPRLEPDAIDVPADVAAANAGVRVYQTPNLDAEQWIGKCGVGFHVEQSDAIRHHLAGCRTCGRDPRLSPLPR